MEQDDKYLDHWTRDWAMFRSSASEINEMLIRLGECKFYKDYIHIFNYPFKPSVVYGRCKFMANEIVNIDTDGTPPTLRIGNELIFISATEKESLMRFASENTIPVVSRKDIWSWILEPFLDTEYTQDTHERLNKLLMDRGLCEKVVAVIRHKVKIQMLKYNFDTMLWDWVHLGADDVLRAMRTACTEDEFEDFYKKVMHLALFNQE